jgi:hypothetical protein
MLKDNALRIGYSFDYIISARAAKSPTSQEFMISYKLPPPNPNGKSITRTPRFRH